MYEQFTDRARKVMMLANQEARRFNHEYIGTEHILLGLVKEASGVAAKVLKNLGIDLRKIRLEVEKIVQAGPDMVTTGKLPQTPRAKKVIEYAIEESHNLAHPHVGTEHLLLGLLREGEGVAAQVLMNLLLRLPDVRKKVQETLGHNISQAGREPLVTPTKATNEILTRLPLLQVFEDYLATIDELGSRKEAAICEQDFEKAAHLRDRADKLMRKVEDAVKKLRDIIRESGEGT